MLAVKDTTKTERRERWEITYLKPWVISCHVVPFSSTVVMQGIRSFISGSMAIILKRATNQKQFAGPIEAMIIPPTAGPITLVIPIEATFRATALEISLFPTMSIVSEKLVV